jgi:pyridoxamine 5'-phosphate oxidase
MEDFLKQIKNDHREFDHGKLEGFFGKEPFTLFRRWYKEAFSANSLEPNSFVLSTVDVRHRPSSRILYLKELTDENFIFFTNYNSRKGQDLAQNDEASMLFFWPNMERQIRINGMVEKVSSEISDAYFATRPRGSQVGAWASNQSEKLATREELEKKVTKYAHQFPKEVPRPHHWGGYLLKPSLIEFWQGRPSRLHDRIIFEKKDMEWEIYRTSP